MGTKQSHHSLTTLFLLRQMFQVVHSEKPLYVQAGNCVEASEWLEVLSQVSRCNEGRLATFHPSNYTSGAWQCCQSLSSNAPGCKPCTTWVFPPHQHHREGRGGGEWFSTLAAIRGACVADHNKRLIKLPAGLKFDWLCRCSRANLNLLIILSCYEDISNGK